MLRAHGIDDELAPSKMHTSMKCGNRVAAVVRDHNRWIDFQTLHHTAARKGCTVKLRQIGGSGCGNGPCPAVYETENGTIVVQGFQVDSTKAGLQLPPGENAVEIPRYILEQVFSQ